MSGREAAAAPVLADDPQAEQRRLASALAAMPSELDAPIAAAGIEPSGEPAAVLDASRMIATKRARSGVSRRRSRAG